MKRSLIPTRYLLPVALLSCTTPERTFLDVESDSPAAEAGVPGTDRTSDGGTSVMVPDWDASVQGSDADTSTTTSSTITLELEDAATTTETADSSDSGYVPSCGGNEDCDDGNPCNGEEQCLTGSCVAATAAENGSFCDIGDNEDRVCRDGNCLVSRCGDGIVDERWNEQCDDANSVDGDGCDRGCVYSCSVNADCDDSNICNGTETCDATLHACVAGTWLEDETSCGEDYACRGGRCLSMVCGNGALDADEECDDGNLLDNDGCESDCTFSCNTDADCDDGNLCNGAEQCNVATHTCQTGTSLVCDDDNACTTNACLPDVGCTFTLIDADNDGQASTTLGACGLDCDDDQPLVFSGAAELCDKLDNDCDGDVDETAPVWYSDCDGDGFAPADAEAVQQCDMPSRMPSTCPRGFVGGWTSRTPKEGTDCWDIDPDVYPRANAPFSATASSGRPTEYDYDYDCNREEERQYTTVNQSSRAMCNSSLIVSPNATGVELIDGALSDLDESLLHQLDDLGIQPAPLIIPIIQPCYGASGWTGATIPACGTEGEYTYCSGVGRCARVTGATTQKCR